MWCSRVRKVGAMRRRKKKETPVFSGVCAALHDAAGVSSGARGTLTSPKNAAKTGKPIESGAHVVQSTELGARWHEIRDLIADCPDLLPEARRSLIAQGDEVVASS